MNTPVLFLIFNRIDTSLRVFEQIRQAQPKHLYIAADGYRSHKAGEKEVCEQLRQAIINGINWDCEVKTLFRDSNLGCGEAVSSAILWFFENVEEGIILEDDCLPVQSFFDFSTKMLEKYRNDDRVGHISGSNYQQGVIRGDGSYYYSSLTNIWGWAGWRRVWKDYDLHIASLPKFEKLNGFEQIASIKPFKNFWKNCLNKHYTKTANSWDYQYAYLNLINHRLSVIPNTNLVSNIGFENVETATHFRKNHPLSNLLSCEMDVNNIVAPTFMIADVEADIHAQMLEMGIPPKNLFSRIKRNVKYALSEARNGRLIIDR